MTANSSSIKYTLFMLFGLSAHAVQAQVDTTKRKPGELPPTMEQVEVVRDYRPILADAVKIRQSPDLTNIRAYQPKLKYSIQDKKLDINTGTHRLEIQPLADLRRETLYNSYAKLGVGNLSTLNGEVYLASGEDEFMQYGGFARHLSQKGKLEGQSFSQQKIGVFARSILDDFTLDGEIGFKRNASNYYGYNPDLPDANLDPSSIAYSDIYAKGELTSNFTDNDALLSYSVKADAYLFSNNYDAGENAFAISANVNKRVNVFNIGANVSGDFASVKDAAYSIGNHIGKINPYVRFKGKGYNLTLGANFVSEFGSQSQTNIFPAVNLELAFIPEYATIYAGVDGDVKRTSLRTLAYENPYLNTNIAIENMTEKFNAYGGIKGNGGATLGYKAGVFYKRINDLPFYVNAPNTIGPADGSIYNFPRFDLIYDNGENNIYGLEGEIDFQVSEAFKLGGKVTISEYDIENEEEAWFMPKFRAEGNTRINITDKVFVTGELLFVGQTYAKVYESPYFGETASLEYTKVTVPAFADLSAGIEYRITPRIGVYAQFNNLLNTSYQRFLYYPRLGFNAIGGVNFSF